MDDPEYDFDAAVAEEIEEADFAEARGRGGRGRSRARRGRCLRRNHAFAGVVISEAEEEIDDPDATQPEEAEPRPEPEAGPRRNRICTIGGRHAVAASSADDVPTQLAALLGKEAVQIRKTDRNPPQASIYDVISAVTGLNGNHAGKAYRDRTARYPEVHSVGVNFRFPGRGQRDTPVANVRGIVEIIMLLPGQQAARVRRQAAELLCRYWGTLGPSKDPLGERPSSNPGVNF